MKKIISTVFALALSCSSFAGSFHCNSDTQDFEVTAVFDEPTRTISQLEFLKFEDTYRLFENLSYRSEIYKKPFSKKRYVSFEVVFNQAFIYLELEREIVKGVPSSTGKGVFIPKNSVIAIERDLTCKFN